MLAMALEVQGDLAGAAEALAEASGERDRINHFSGPSWLRVLQRIALTYRKQGKPELAQTVEAELLELLTYADRDHPILVQIQEVQAAGS